MWLRAQIYYGYGSKYTKMEKKKKKKKKKKSNRYASIWSPKCFPNVFAKS
jgi:hypothetical protein